MKISSVSVLVILLYVSGQVKCDIPDEQYSLMPELFYLDNFDHCMLRKQEALYCTFTFELEPLSDNNTVWNIIQNVSASPQNYNHRNLRHGICVPTSCQDDYKTAHTTAEAIQNCYRRKMLPLGFSGKVTHLNCQGSKSKYPTDVYDWLAAALLTLYVLFVMFASFYERMVLRNSSLKKISTVGKILEAFSFYKNWKRLMSIPTSPDHKKLRALQGMRFYTMFCIVMSHTLLGIFSGPISNTRYTEDMTKKFLNMMVANGWYIVQSFFVISGFLTAYNFFDMKLKKKATSNSFFIWAIFLRYIRIVPAMFVVMALHSTWLVHTFNGPYWDEFVGQEYRNCRNNWWANILLVNNHVNLPEICMQHSWYLSADMQIFILAMVVLFIVNKYPEKVLHIFGVVLGIGLIIPGIVAYVRKYDILYRQYPEYLYMLESIKIDVYVEMLDATYTNLFGFSIGMLCGYFFVQYKDKDMTKNKVVVALWWILLFTMGLSVMFVAYIFYDPYYQYTAFQSAMYWSLGKCLYSIAIAMMIFALSQGSGWAIRWCFERDIVQILGRITFSCYLIHIIFIRMEMGYRRWPSSLNDTMSFIAVLGDLTCAYLAGLVLCLLVEMPISALQKLFFRGIKESNESSITDKPPASVNFTNHSYVETERENTKV